MFHIPQTYIYTIIFLITVVVHFLFPQLSPLLKVLETIWLIFIVLSGVLEYYLDRKYGKNIGDL